MKKSLAVLALALCSQAFAGTLIDDGIKANRNAFPGVVKISIFQNQNNKEVLMGNCSGTLIAHDVVVTAAHCLMSGVTTRVSLAGDELGKADKASGGIKVISSFKNAAHATYSNLYQQGMKLIQTEEFRRLSAYDQQSITKEIVQASILMRGLDIGFLVLEKKQVFPAGKKPSTLGCKQSLSVGSAVTIAGYGRKAGKIPGVNYNEADVLNFGTNTVVANQTLGLTYKLDQRAGFQVANSGDSGGPMFKKADQSVVFGVTSAGIPDKNDRTTEVDYANLSSQIAKKVYQGILDAKTAPESLTTILKACK